MLWLLQGTDMPETAVSRVETDGTVPVLGQWRQRPLTCMSDLAGGCGLQVLSVSLKSDHLRPARSTAADTSGTSSCGRNDQQPWPDTHCSQHDVWVVGGLVLPIQAAPAAWQPRQQRLRHLTIPAHT